MTRLVALTLCAWLAGCASGPEPKGDPAGATLELVNRTREDIAVDVRGRVEATVHPGARARIYDLRPGTASVFARSVAGGAGAFEQRDMLTLKRGERTTWVVMPDAAGGEPLPEPPALATLIVTNTLPAHVRVTLDGVAPESLWLTLTVEPGAIEIFLGRVVG